MPGLTARLVLAVILGTVASAARMDFASAQTPVDDTRGPRFLLASAASPSRTTPLDVSRTPVLRRRINLVLEDVSLKEALAVIAREAGLDLAYAEGVVPLQNRINLRAEGITVAAALTDVLMDANVDIVFMPEGRAVLRPIVARPPSGTVTGRITDARTNAGLAAVEVFLDGTRWRTMTDIAGRYRLVEIDTGTYTLTARRLGYAMRRTQVTVRPEREDTVDVALSGVATRLDEVVTTATGQRRRLELGNDITRINADSIVRGEPVTSLTDILETRVPGLSVQHTSGAPGDPSRLRLRGAASPLRSNDPIVIVDGVRIYAEQSASRSGNMSMPLSADPGLTPYATPSPIDNIDPNTIDKIEVFKGPAAATLYGQDAANGVIVITTKKGQAGPPQWTASAEHGVTKIAGDYPDLFLRWGHVIGNNMPVACPVANQFGDFEPLACEGDSIVTFQLLNDPKLTVLDKGHRTGVTLGVSGGNSALTYHVTGSFRDETGLPKLPSYEVDRYQTRIGSTPPDWMRRPQQFMQWDMTGTFGARLGTKADITLSTRLTRTKQQRSSLEGRLGALMGTYLDQVSGTYYQQGLNTTSIFPVTNAVAGYFERATAANLMLTPSVNVSWRPRAWLNLTSDVGLNVEQRSDQTFTPRGVGNGKTSPRIDTIGYVAYGRGTSIVSTVNLRANTAASIGRGFQFQFATGVNYTGTSIEDLSLRSSDLPPGTSQIGSIISPFEVRPGQRDDATFGWYLEPSVNNGRFFANLGLRLDGGSAYGSNATLPKFPKVNFSYLVSDESFYPLKNIIPTLRLRMAYGRASRQPGVTDRLRLYTASQGVLGNGTTVGGVFLQTIGNDSLRPELTAEFEAGFDANLLDDRLQVSFTGYRKTTEDALLPTPVPPSIYGLGITQIRNIGVFRNSGLELTVAGQLVRSGPITWGTQVTMSQNRNLVVRLGPGVLPFYTDGDPLRSGLRVAAGYPLFGRWARPLLGYTDANSNGVIDQSEILVGDTAVYVGATIPNFEANFQTTVSLWQGAVALTAGVQYQDGLSQLNNVAQNLVAFSRGWNDPTTPVAQQVTTSTVTDYNWIQTVNTVRFNSFTVAYRVPQTFARRVGARALRVAIQGSNLGLWTDYRGLDPNVNAFGTGNDVTDTGVLPEPRTWQIRVNATY